MHVVHFLSVVVAVFFSSFFSSKVGRASLKLNAGSAGECDCEWMKRDVSVRQAGPLQKWRTNL